ncbi:MAG: protein sorting system archaetidylserine synthase [Halobacteriaceae archaeon]
MRPRFLGRLGLADAVSAANAGLGFCAVAVLPAAPALGARLVLLAAIADGLDGVVARARGSTPVGEHVDSLADVASFGVAPAALVAAAVADGVTLPVVPGVPLLAGGAGAGGSAAPTVAPGDPLHLVLALLVPAAFTTMAVIRLAFYTAFDVENAHTVGVQSTLAGTILAVAVLVSVPGWLLVAATAGFTYLMVAEVEYPDLHRYDALVIGVVQVGAVLAPGFAGGLFPWALLAWALAYLAFGPWLYWR